MIDERDPVEGPRADEASKGWLIIKPEAGLGNRVRAIASGMRLARRFGRKAAVLWLPDAACGCQFEALFEPRPWFFGSSEELAKHVSMESETSAYFTPPPWGPLVLNLDGLAARNVLVDTWAILFDESDRANGAFPASLWLEIRPYLAELRPAAGVAETVAAMGAACGIERRVGVHVRQTDHPVGLGVPLSRFTDAMAAYSAGQGFFVAADNPAAEASLCSSFPDRCFTQPKIAYDRAAPAALAHALVDLLLLSATRRIVSSGSSSFSRVAAALGSVPLTELGRAEPPPGHPEDAF